MVWYWFLLSAVAHACQEPGGEVGDIHLSPSIYYSPFQIALLCYPYIVWIFQKMLFFPVN